MRAFAVIPCFLALFSASAAAALADETAAVRDDALVLLARSARAAGSDPRDLRVDNVTLQGDRARVQWSLRGRTSYLELRRQGSRWFAGAEGVPTATWPPQAIDPRGGILNPAAAQTGGYDLALHYASSDAAPDARFSFVYGRAPTQAEFLPYPTTYPFTSESVFYFDVAIAASKPITFATGTTVGIWFPFVLDDRLRYDLFLDGAYRPIGPLTSTVFDNALTFTLPAFTVAPGKTLVGEIDGDPH